MVIIKLIVSKLLFGVLLLYLLFYLLTMLYGSSRLQRYIHSIDGVLREDRYGALADESIVFTDYTFIVFSRDIHLNYLDNPIEAIERLREGKYKAYIISDENIESYSNVLEGFRLTGRNRILRGYSFLVLQDSLISVPDIENKIITNYFIWLKEMITNKHNWGLDRDGIHYVRITLMNALPFTLSLLIMCVILMLIVSLPLSYILASNMSDNYKNTIDHILEILSSIPEFLLCFMLIIFIARPKNLLPVYDFAFIKFPSDFKGLISLFNLMILPTIAIISANGTTSTLVKYLVARISQVKNSHYYSYFKANGTNWFYLDFIITFKELIPLIARYISMKMPLIIGTSIVVEMIFNIQGISNIAFKNFRGLDNGYILAIFFIVYIVTFASEIVAESITLLTFPERSKV